LEDRRQKPLLQSRLLEPKALVTQIQTAQFNFVCHALALFPQPFGSWGLFVEPDHSMIDLLAPRQGVLSQILCQHQQHLAAADWPALNQADDHPHVLEHHRAWLGGANWNRRFPGPRRRARPGGGGPGVGASRPDRQPTAALIDLPLSLLSLLLAVIGPAAPQGLSPAVFRPATKGAAD